jgi:hypothetical protein
MYISHIHFILKFHIFYFFIIYHYNYIFVCHAKNVYFAKIVLSSWDVTWIALI